MFLGSRFRQVLPTHPGGWTALTACILLTHGNSRSVLTVWWEGQNNAFEKISYWGPSCEEVFGFCLRGVGTPLLAPLMEEDEDRGKEEETSLGEGSRKCSECLEAAREEGVKPPEAGMGRGSGWDGWGGQRGPPLTELVAGNSRHVHFMALRWSLNSLVLGPPPLWPSLPSEKSALRKQPRVMFLWGVTEGRCVLCRLKVADETGRDSLGSGSWRIGKREFPDLRRSGRIGF